nr:GtrA family protein [Desulfosporosinus sp. OT]
MVFLSVNYIVANVISYSIGTINSYLWNKGWVFNSNERHSKILYKFIGVNSITLSFNSSVLYALVSIFSLNKLTSQIIATLLGMTLNFILNKLWTFGGRKVKKCEKNIYYR